MEFFVDGALQGTNFMTGTLTLTSAGATKFALAAYNSSGTPDAFGFAGSLDDVRIYLRSISDTELSSLYNGGTGSDDPLVVSAASSNGELQSTALITATNCTSGSLQILADTAGYDSGAWNTTTTSLWARVSGDNGTTFTNANLSYIGRWANTNYVSLRGSFDIPVAGSQLVYRVYLSNSAPALLKGSIIWGVP